jgi:hypothetical protein
VWVRRKLRELVLQDGTVIGSETRELEPGTPVTVQDVTHTVLSSDSARIVVLAPPPPPKMRKIVDDEGEQVGTHEGAVEIGAELSTNDGMFRVVRVTDKAIFAEPSLTPAGA